MKMRAPQFLAVCLASALPLAVAAEPPGPKRGGGGERPQGGDHPRMNRGGPGEWNPEKMEQFRAQLEAFCKEHARNRWAEVDKLREKGGSEAGKALMMSMVRRFAGLQALEKEDKELYAIKVREIEVEDAEYGLLMDLKKADAGDKEKVERIKTDLRSNSKQYVDLRLQERSHRIAKLAGFLAKEKAAVEQDRLSQDRLIDERVEQLVAEGPDFFNPKFPPRRGEGAATSPAAGGNGAPLNAAPER